MSTASPVPSARSGWTAVIGLEIHAQLRTASKMFSRAPVSFGAPPNSQVNEVCAGLPGTLPTVNRRAVELGVLAGIALGCEVHTWSQFARKNYFYPDLPKGYQISQFEHPLCEHGRLSFDVDGRSVTCGITRLHLEEDSGKSQHGGEEGWSRIDLNRAGTALVEIVSEPDLRTAAEAAAYFKELRAILMALGVNDGNLAEGSMRCDANISVRRGEDAPLGTKVEIKNLNSFKFLREGIDHEIERQIALIEGGGEVRQETRTWSESRRETVLLRSKEGSADYRYFPEPDLPPLIVTQEEIERLRGSLPELPARKRERLQEEHGLSAYDADVLVSGDGLLELFDEAVKIHDNPKGLCNLLAGAVSAALNEGSLRSEAGQFVTGTGHAITPGALAELQALVDDGRLSTTMARDVWERMLSDGREPERIVSEDGLEQVSDTGALSALVQGVLEANPEKVAAYRAGKTGLMGFFVGQVMRSSGGKADPRAVNEILSRALQPD
ncbi:MAG: Asp-tRNA(Asn)/Glu-tRNA(Gln) amidotransferase subunit GatB [Deltaproteobacteria bacterium]|nr:MAG: Asp-tRNA(Asn)/Glu-tRNA(Gln) amidotransferase subunit GatB [Deltaproteobacteria bacterium]